MSHQPRPLADESRDYLTGRFRLNPVPYARPRGIRVDPPLQRDAAPGYILSRAYVRLTRRSAIAELADSVAAARVNIADLQTAVEFGDLANRGRVFTDGTPGGTGDRVVL